MDYIIGKKSLDILFSVSPIFFPIRPTHMSTTIYLCQNGETPRVYKYNPDDVLGKGGFGTVFQCTENDECTSYALKELKIRKDKRDKDMIKIYNEIDNLRTIQEECNRYLLCIKDWGFSCSPTGTKHHGRYYYIVMEDLSSWSTLSEFIHDQKPKLLPSVLPYHMLIGLVNEMTAGLLFLHKRFEMSHLDIKPDNIFVRFDKDGPRVKYIDFGLAELCNPSKKKEKINMRGTYIYMDMPTACMDNMACYQSDYYSLGMVFIYMFTGEKLTKNQVLSCCLDMKENACRTFIDIHSLTLENFLKDANYTYIDIFDIDPTKRIISEKTVTKKKSSKPQESQKPMIMSPSMSLSPSVLPMSTTPVPMPIPMPPPSIPILPPPSESLQSGETTPEHRSTQSKSTVPPTEIVPRPPQFQNPNLGPRPGSERFITPKGGGSTRKRKRRRRRAIKSRRYYRNK